eukprot:3520372-Alexandrium_andersonii.AAC.1
MLPGMQPREGWSRPRRAWAPLRVDGPEDDRAAPARTWRGAAPSLGPPIATRAFLGSSAVATAVAAV